MKVPIIMPKTSMMMEKGTILEWFKSEGDFISVGESLFFIETDKVAIEVEAEASGILSEILIPQGETVPILSIVGYIHTERENQNISNNIDPKGILVDIINTDDTQSPAYVKLTDVENIQNLQGFENQYNYKHNPGYYSADIDERFRDIYSENHININNQNDLIDKFDKKLKSHKSKVKATPNARAIAKGFGVSLYEINTKRADGVITSKDVVKYKEETSILLGVANQKHSNNTYIQHTPACIQMYIKVSNLLSIIKKYNKMNFSNLKLSDCFIRSCSIAFKKFRGFFYSKIKQVSKDLNILLINQPSGSHFLLENVMDMCIQSISKTKEVVQQQLNANTLNQFNNTSMNISQTNIDNLITITDLSDKNIHAFIPSSENSLINIGIGSIEEYTERKEGQISTEKRICVSLVISDKQIDTATGVLFLSSIKENIEKSKIFH